MSKITLRTLIAAILVFLFFSPITGSAAPFLWSGDSSGRLGTIDLTNGDVNVIGDMGVTMTDIAFDPGGNLWGITFSSLYRIDANTAAVTYVGELGTNANSLVFDSYGNLYTANTSLHTVDTSTGAASNIGNGGYAYSSSGDLAFIGDELFLSSSGGDQLVQISTDDGSGTLIGNIGFSAVFGLASPNRTDLFGMTGTEIISIDPTTGMGTSILDYSGQGLSLAWGSAFASESVVPVPAAIWLFVAGILALIGFSKNLQKTNKY